MAESAEALLARLQSERSEMLQTVGDWSAQQLALEPDSGTWSVVQVFDHLCRVDESFAIAVRANLPEGQPITARDRLGCFAVICLMRSPARVKTPAAARSMIPARHAELPDILERWQQADLKLRMLLTDVPPPSRTAGVFRHPVGGWMTLATGFDFLLAHQQHHGHQLRRLQKLRLAD